MDCVVEELGNRRDPACKACWSVVHSNQVSLFALSQATFHACNPEHRLRFHTFRTREGMGQKIP